MEEVKAEMPTDAEAPLPMVTPSPEGVQKRLMVVNKTAAASAELRESSSYPLDTASLRAQQHRGALEALAQSETGTAVNTAAKRHAAARPAMELEVEADGGVRAEDAEKEQSPRHKALQQEARGEGVWGSGSVPLEAAVHVADAASAPASSSAGSTDATVPVGGEAAALIPAGEGDGDAQTPRSGDSRTTSLRESMNNPLVSEIKAAHFS